MRVRVSVRVRVRVRVRRAGGFAPACGLEKILTTAGGLEKGLQDAHMTLFMTVGLKMTYEGNGEDEVWVWLRVMSEG